MAATQLLSSETTRPPSRGQSSGLNVALQALFRAYDKNSNDNIDIDEFVDAETALAKARGEELDRNVLVTSFMDINMSGAIRYSQFHEWQMRQLADLDVPGMIAEVNSRVALLHQVASGGAPQLRQQWWQTRTFEQLQRNDIIEMRPQILHFGGFQIHKEHTHVLRVLNISPSSLRLTIIGPSSQWFRISYDKKGLLAPGMSEEIKVTFSPHEWRYYYDTVKIFCGELSENLIVPIHAYPSANDIKLPRIIDFGNVAIGTSRSKVVPLSCKIPIQFEFEITVLEAHPDFEVTPLSGVIPADGIANVGITFKPTRHRTASTELQFNISQFDFEPVVMSVMGSCLPELSHQEVLKAGHGEFQASDNRKLEESMASRVHTLKGKKKRSALENKPPLFPEETTETTIEGVKVPVRFDQQATNYVLNQTAGKLPLKDLFSFIKEQREVAEQRREKAEARGEDNQDDNEDDGDAQALELRFELRYREVAKYDKDKELNSKVALGEEPMTEAAITQENENRQRKHGKIVERRIQTDSCRAQSNLSQDRVLMPTSYRSHKMVPHWDENTHNDTFSMRLQVIDRLVRAGSKVLAQKRAQKRMDLLKAAMGVAAVTDPDSCRLWVDAENKSASASGGAKSGPAAETSEGDDVDSMIMLSIGPEFVLPVQIPIMTSLMSTEDRLPVEVMPLDNFEKVVSAGIATRMDYKVLHYENYIAPPPAAYMKPNTRTPLHGALEESLVRGNRGDIFDGAEEPMAMPDSCLLPPQYDDPLSMLLPSTSCRTYVAFPEFTECDFEYRLTQPLDLIGPLQTEPLLPANLMCLERPWIGTFRRQRRLHDAFEHFDPLPPCFAEAGGKQGPRIGCDPGGERLSFLPVGGFARDVPSDTDSDQREDFDVAPPADEEYEAALCRLSTPCETSHLRSELWTLKQAEEERLNAQCAANNCAARNNINELNKEIDYRNKIYLA